MLLLRNISLPYTAKPEELANAAAGKCGINKEEIRTLRLVSKSLDARKKPDIRYLYSVVLTLEEKTEKKVLAKKKSDVSLWNAPQLQSPVPGSVKAKGRFVVVGLGPAGLFAAYILAKHGYAPLVIERGKPVAERSKDVQLLWDAGILENDSNPMFGEGGAGTFSDGKLTSRSKDPRGAEVLRILVENGAPEEISWLAKPHLGTDRLKRIVSEMRRKIESLGGEVRFSAKLTGFHSENGKISEVIVTQGKSEERIPCAACVLAVGLGARDTWRMLHQSGIHMVAKPFAVGVRIEHPQEMINRSQFGNDADIGILGAAEYRVTAESNGRGVYSFCMCPGGFVVNTSSDAGMISVNGMSYAARSGENANAALIAQVRTEEFGNDPLCGIDFCEKIERKAMDCTETGRYVAPASRLDDFLRRRKSGAFGSVVPTVRPYPVASNLWECLPEDIASSIALSISEFARKIKGFDLPDAVVTAPETRSSAPLRIVRDPIGESVSMAGLYPTGEGAGYAGGIISAAIDGMHQAERIITKFARPRSVE